MDTGVSSGLCWGLHLLGTVLETLDVLGGEETVYADGLVGLAGEESVQNLGVARGGVVRGGDLSKLGQHFLSIGEFEGGRGQEGDVFVEEVVEQLVEEVVDTVVLD